MPRLPTDWRTCLILELGRLGCEGSSGGPGDPCRARSPSSLEPESRFHSVGPSSLSYSSVAYMQLHPPGTFLLDFVELLNIQVSAQSFPWPLLWAPVTRMPSSHSTYNTYHSLTIQRTGARGCSSLHAQGLAEGVWRGWKAEGSWELGLSLGWGGGDWIWPSESCSFNSCWPGWAWAPALPPVLL